MKKVFLDSSCLIKLYHDEIDSNVVKNIISDIEEIFLSDITILEFRSAIWKKIRERNINEDIGKEVISCFQQDYEKFQWIKFDSNIIQSAVDLLMNYGKKGLRTLDSLQLASALTLKSGNCIFLTSDKLLKTFFKDEKLNVI